ncbi:hypothetical protein RFI_39115 [Reticulomyxa filosa]|uniref:FHA domain-containing protein n=1 Tax=Reticulomyxa filosa TaxID=46433 RepID=X6LAN9_RETFI|nr:hypothetical protein RFI_39115 [Reticulomyxa filosa]|eukprot:ETN98395.1 hypothetical protein RFI_39115 [Reticulomyxa filosa]
MAGNANMYGFLTLLGTDGNTINKLRLDQQEYIFGRDEAQCDFIIVKKNVSRMHAKLWIDKSSQVWISNISTRNNDWAIAHIIVELLSIQATAVIGGRQKQALPNSKSESVWNDGTGNYQSGKIKKFGLAKKINSPTKELAIPQENKIKKRGGASFVMCDDNNPHHQHSDITIKANRNPIATMITLTATMTMLTMTNMKTVVQGCKEMFQQLADSLQKVFFFSFIQYTLYMYIM